MWLHYFGVLLFLFFKFVISLCIVSYTKFTYEFYQQNTKTKFQCKLCVHFLQLWLLKPRFYKYKHSIFLHSITFVAAYWSCNQMIILVNYLYIPMLLEDWQHEGFDNLLAKVFGTIVVNVFRSIRPYLKRNIFPNWKNKLQIWGSKN